MDVNIGGVKDEFYRYKMPALQTKVEGRGNGIKTVLPNMSEVARALKRPTEYPTKYFGLELGAQSKYTANLDKAVVNGCHETRDLVELLNKFIKIFVLCEQCGNPETNMTIDKKDNVFLKCLACGHVTAVSPAERLTTYIVKHPPDSLMNGDSENGKKKGKKGKKKAKDKGDKEVEETTEEVEKMIINEAKAAEETLHPGDRLRKFLQDSPDGDSAAVTIEVCSIIDDYKLSAKDAIRLVFEVLFKDAPVANLQKYAVVLKNACAGKKGRNEVMKQLEKLVGKEDEALKHTPIILKAFYDEDILEEDFILDWFKKGGSSKDKPSFEKFKRAASSFLDWLEEAEEESSEDED